MPDPGFQSDGAFQFAEDGGFQTAPQVPAGPPVVVPPPIVPVPAGFKGMSLSVSGVYKP